jgi:hydrogenase maturation protease
VRPEASEASGLPGQRTRSILVAGVGNAWLRDDGFGGAVAEALSKGALPDGVEVMDFGSGGLDLAYEVMRGYDALILIDVSRQGGEPGTLYVMEASEDDVESGIEDGQVIDPHGMDPQTVLRFVKTVGGWPGRVMVVACEPEVVEDVGFGLSDSVGASVEKAVDVVRETIAELSGDA